MDFRRYQHLEKYGTQATEGIQLGTVYIMPKIDGTNASVWLDEGQVQAGSRSRTLDETTQGDNAGFCKWARANANIESFLHDHQDLRLYGEWLVKHSLTTYRDDAWKEFYVFDVVREHGIGEGEDDFTYLHYEEYRLLLEEYGINYIPPIAILKNANDEFIYGCLEKNGYLIKDGEGMGEGIVIKNYDFVSRFGKTVWAKIVTNEFKEKHHKAMGAPEVIVNKVVEDNVVEEFLTEALIEKEYAKIVNEAGEWTSKLIPRLLNTVFYSLVDEEMWNIVKALKNPTIDFKRLQQLVFMKVKATKSELF